MLHDVANIIFLEKTLPFEVHFRFAPQTPLPFSPEVRNLLPHPEEDKHHCFVLQEWKISPTGKEKPPQRAVGPQDVGVDSYRCSQ